MMMMMILYTFTVMVNFCEHLHFFCFLLFIWSFA